MNQNLLFLFLFLPLFSFGQKITVSEEISLRNDIAYDLLGDLKGNILVFRDQDTEFEVQAFDQNLNKSWDKKLEFDKRQARVLNVFSTDTSFVVLYRFRYRSRTILKAHLYDPGANLKDSVTIKDFGYLFYTPNFEIQLSEDKSKALIYYVEKQTIVKALGFDVENFQLLWDKNISPEDFIYGRDFVQSMINNDGDLYLVFEKDNMRSRKENHHFEIHSYNWYSDMFDSYYISMNNMLTYDVLFTYDNMNNLLVAGGLYTEKNLGKAMGYFYFNISPESPDDYQLSFISFDTEFLTDISGKEIEENKGITEASVRELVLRRDGGILLILEKNRQYERRAAYSNRVYYDGSSRFIVDYYYDELLIISLHPNGDVHWKTILHKKQYSQDDDGIYSSYFLFKSPSSLRFLFNDEIKHENTVSEYVLKGTGSYDRNSLLSTENWKIRLRFRDGIQIGSDSFIVPSERRNKLKLVRFNYN